MRVTQGKLPVGNDAYAFGRNLFGKGALSSDVAARLGLGEGVGTKEECGRDKVCYEFPCSHMLNSYLKVEVTRPR